MVNLKSVDLTVTISVNSWALPQFSTRDLKMLDGPRRITMEQLWMTAFWLWNMTWSRPLYLVISSRRPKRIQLFEKTLAEAVQKARHWSCSKSPENNFMISETSKGALNQPYLYWTFWKIILYFGFIHSCIIWLTCLVVSRFKRNLYYQEHQK